MHDEFGFRLLQRPLNTGLHPADGVDTGQPCSEVPRALGIQNHFNLGKRAAGVDRTHHRVHLPVDIHEFVFDYLLLIQRNLQRSACPRCAGLGRLGFFASGAGLFEGRLPITARRLPAGVHVLEDSNGLFDLLAGFRQGVFGGLDLRVDFALFGLEFRTRFPAIPIGCHGRGESGLGRPKRSGQRGGRDAEDRREKPQTSD